MQSSQDCNLSTSPDVCAVFLACENRIAFILHSMTSTLVILWISVLWDMFLLREFQDAKQHRCSHNQQISVSSGILVSLRFGFSGHAMDVGNACVILDFCEWWYFDATAFWVFQVDM